MYSKLNEIYARTRMDMFAMAISYAIDKGVEFVSQMEDNEIDELKGNGLMTDDFCKALVRLSRDIAQATDSGTELIQFADAKGIFETEYYTNGEKLSRDTLEKMVRKLLESILYGEYDFPNSEEEAKESIADYLEVEVESIEKLLEY